MNKKICHITTVHKKNDDRILYKECITLKKSGYDVYLIATSEREEEFSGVKIIPLEEQKGRKDRFLKKRNEAFKKAMDIDADIYHFHDPELLLLGNKLRRNGKKVIYDAHEDVPEQIMSKTYLGNKFIRKLVAKTFNLYEKRSVKKYAGFVTVTQGIADKFYNKNKIVLRNFPVKSIIDASKEKEDFVTNTPTVIYVGGLTKIRGIKEVIQAVGILKGKCRVVLLGEWESNEYFNECKSLDEWQYCSYLGCLPMDQVYQYIKASHIGICVLYSTGNHRASLPIKAFEYMACSKPIIMSDFKYWRENFNEFAVFVEPQKVTELAKAIDILIEDKELYKEKIKRSEIFFQENYSWESESKKLLELYSKILD